MDMQNEAARVDVLDSIVRERRSIRAFLPQPAPRSVIEQVLTTAQLAPSNCNAQPWVVHVVSGETIERLRAALIAAAKTGQTQPDVPLTSTYVGQYRERRIGAAKALFAATGVGRDDARARTVVSAQL
jgi:nitroreductase